MRKYYQFFSQTGCQLTAMALLLPYLNATASLPTARPNPRMSDVEYSMLNVGKGTSYTYTPDGKLATRTWARGITTTYAYTNGSSLASINCSDDTPTVHFSYDVLGRRIAIARSGTAFGDMPVHDSYGYNHRSEVTTSRTPIIPSVG